MREKGEMGRRSRRTESREKEKRFKLIHHAQSQCESVRVMALSFWIDKSSNSIKRNTNQSNDYLNYNSLDNYMCFQVICLGSK